MNLVLKRFSQDVDLSNPEKVEYYLVFATDSGGEIRLPVQKETTEVLVNLLYTPKDSVDGITDDTDEMLEEDDRILEEQSPPDEESYDDIAYSSDVLPDTDEDVPSL